jgi:hypothetical protein
MATATIVKCWKDADNAYAAAAVEEGGSIGRVEYLGITPLGNKSVAQLKTDLTAALKERRDNQVKNAHQAVAISGTVTI